MKDIIKSSSTRPEGTYSSELGRRNIDIGNPTDLLFEKRFMLTVASSVSVRYGVVAKDVYEIKSRTHRDYFLVGTLGSQLRILKPIRLSIVGEDGEISADIPEVEIYAFGDSLSEVIDEITAELIDLYQVLNSEEDLGAYPKNWKQYLTSVIEKI